MMFTNIETSLGPRIICSGCLIVDSKFVVGPASQEVAQQQAIILSTSRVCTSRLVSCPPFSPLDVWLSSILGINAAAKKYQLINNLIIHVYVPNRPHA